MKKLIFLSMLLCMGFSGCSWHIEEPEPEYPIFPPCGCPDDSGTSNPCDGQYFAAPKATLGIDPDCYMANGVKVRVVDESLYFIDGQELRFSKGNRGIYVFTHSSVRHRAIYFQYGDGAPEFMESVTPSGKNYFVLEKRAHRADETLRILIGSEGHWMTSLRLRY
ncbi:MAG: hypothetical protein LBU27_03865 [Candidatus Peribacteria bacterium]|jgi:hypothetical protein|nr:hypothetical protein [Candidatus Peribacteria bacterium]